jgi:hypothetical protein
MRVLAEFVKELTEEHLLQVAPIILPEMSVMISDKDSFSSYTRARAVQVFRYWFFFFKITARFSS